MRLKSEWLGLGGVLALTVLVYLPALAFTFVYDDYPQIISNSYIVTWRLLPQYFTPQLWRTGWSGVFYRPLMMVWLLLNRLVFGLDPRFWHLSSIVLHVTVTFLVFRVAQRITRNREAALLAALIFGIHPIHIEAVAWVSGATDPLVSLLLLPAVLFCLRYEEQRRGRDLCLALVFYTLALFTKEVALLFPAIIVAYALSRKSDTLDVAPDDASVTAQEKQRRIKQAAGVALPFAVLALLYVALRIVLFHGFTSLTTLPWSTQLFTVPSVLLFDLRCLFWPVKLSLFYDFDYVNSPSLLAFWVPLLALFSFAILLMWLARKRGFAAVSFAAWWMLLTVLPALNFRAFHWRDLSHDRYLYLPSVGFAILLAVVIMKLARTARIMVVAILAAALCVGTVAQTGPWASSLLLYYHAVQIAPKNAAGVILLARELDHRNHFSEAEDLYIRVTRLAPNWADGWYGLGLDQERLQQYAPAEQSLMRATELDANNAEALYLLGVVRMQGSHWPEAEAPLRRAVALQPGRQDFQNALSVVLEHQKAGK